MIWSCKIESVNCCRMNHFFARKLLHCLVWLICFVKSRFLFEPQRDCSLFSKFYDLVYTVGFNMIGWEISVGLSKFKILKLTDINLLYGLIRGFIKWKLYGCILHFNFLIIVDTTGFIVYLGSFSGLKMWM